MLENCPCCKRKVLDRKDCGESQVFGSNHLLCEVCWKWEDEAIEAIGTNNLPHFLEQYGRPNMSRDDMRQSEAFIAGIQKTIDSSGLFSKR